MENIMWSLTFETLRAKKSTRNLNQNKNPWIYSTLTDGCKKKTKNYFKKMQKKIQKSK